MFVIRYAIIRKQLQGTESLTRLVELMLGLVELKIVLLEPMLVTPEENVSIATIFTFESHKG